MAYMLSIPISPRPRTPSFLSIYQSSAERRQCPQVVACDGVIARPSCPVIGPTSLSSFLCCGYHEPLMISCASRSTESAWEILAVRIAPEASSGAPTVEEGLRAWIVCLSETCVKHQCASEACLSVSTRIHPRHSLSLSGYRRRGISRHAISRVALDLDNGVLVWRQTWCAFQARQQPDTVGHRRSNRGNGSSAGAIRSVPPRNTPARCTRRNNTVRNRNCF